MLELAKTLRCPSGAAVLSALALSCVGCTGTTTVAATTSYPAPAVVYDYPVTYVEVVPDLQYYPRTYYHGSYAYLVNGRWYYQSRGRWVVFREEPRELYRYRVYDYNRMEPPRRVRGAEYGTAPPSRPRYYERAEPAPQSRDRYYEAPAPQTAPTQRRTRQPAPPPAPPREPAPPSTPPPTQQRYYR